MKQFLFWILCSALVLSLNAQSNCNVDFIIDHGFLAAKTSHEDKSYLVRDIDSIDSKHCWATKFNQYHSYANYLALNYNDSLNFKALLAIEDSVELQQKYVQNLRSDSGFVKQLRKWLASSKNMIPDTFTVDELMNVAVKFYDLTGINETGHYMAKICVGINAIHKTIEKSSPQLEAFAFTVAIGTDDRAEALTEIFINTMKRVYTIELGVDDEDQLLRAQGAIYFAMHQNEKVRDYFMQAYREQSEFLPFVIASERTD